MNFMEYFLLYSDISFHVFSAFFFLSYNLELSLSVCYILNVNISNLVCVSEMCLQSHAHLIIFKELK